MAPKQQQQAKAQAAPPSEQISEVIPEEVSEVIPEEVSEVIPSETVETTPGFPAGNIVAPNDIFIGPDRLMPAPMTIDTGVVLDVPPGYVAILSITQYLAQNTKVRLAGPHVIKPAAGSVKLALDNTSVDPYWMTKGTPIVDIVIVKGE